MNLRFTFNRAMDTSIDPQIFYGVVFPYTQNLIDEEGYLVRGW